MHKAAGLSTTDSDLFQDGVSNLYGSIGTTCFLSFQGAEKKANRIQQLFGMGATICRIDFFRF